MSNLKNPTNQNIESSQRNRDSLVQYFPVVDNVLSNNLCKFNMNKNLVAFVANTILFYDTHT